MNEIHKDRPAFRVDRLNFYAGARFGLAGKTAFIEVSLPEVGGGVPADWSRMDAAIERWVTLLCPPEARSSDWQDLIVEVSVGDAVTLRLACHFARLLLLMQLWAREPVVQARILSARAGRCQLAVDWGSEKTLEGAAVQAMLLIGLSSRSVSAQGVERHRAVFSQWLESRLATATSPANFRFMMAAHRRAIPVIKQPGFLQFGWGRLARRLDSAFTQSTPAISTRLARRKPWTNQLFVAAGLPVPAQVLVTTFEQALQAAGRLGWPVVIKPADQDQGTAVVANIRSPERLQAAFVEARRYSPGSVICEKHVDGADHRILVVGGHMRVATRRLPAGVQGDGVRSVVQLMEALNADPRRGTGKRSMLMRVELDAQALACLADQGLQEHDVPEHGRLVRMRSIANVSAGGTAEDVTPSVHPDNRVLAERAARVVGLDIAGVDFICPDISQSWRRVGGAICEVNAQPGLRVHWLAQPERDINDEILGWVTQGSDVRIPTAAVTGTNGKSTVARMLHRIWQTSGKVTGVATTQGVWVGDDLVQERNLSGFPGGRILLTDPAVEAAVIEMPRKGLLKFGHPCDRYDVAALLNVQDDHIGVDSIHSLEEMALLKAEVLERAAHAVVINGEDPMCLLVRHRAGAARQILVGRSGDTPALLEHMARGAEAVFIQACDGKPWIMLAQGARRTPLMPLHDVPAVMRGMLRFNEVNALFAAAMAWAQGLALDTIALGLKEFHNSLEDNPGRYNFLDGFPFQVMLDFGHNPAGLVELCSLVQQLQVSGRRHLLTTKIGNRHASHLRELAPALAQTFDRIVLGCEARSVNQAQDYAGADPVGNMLAWGMKCLMEAGADADSVRCEADLAKGMRRVLEGARPGDLVVLLADPWEVLPVLPR